MWTKIDFCVTRKYVPYRVYKTTEKSSSYPRIPCASNYKRTKMWNKYINSFHHVKVTTGFRQQTTLSDPMIRLQL
jgi:hypothetical protein